jgi:HEPN domain-containing protein
MDATKRELVRRWLLKASHDLRAAQLLANDDRPVLDVAIYHCQQAGEKALKGFLIYWDREFEKTHNLGLLLQKVVEIEPCFASWEDAADGLTSYATLYRYPRAVLEPDPEQVDEAFNDASGIFQQVLNLLPTEVHPEPPGSHSG